jgi:uncharacterized membrane protein
MMDAEAAVVNLFFTFRVCLVGGILLVFPRITRKGLLFGIYVGEAIAEGDAARSLRRSWDLGVFKLMGLAFFVGWGISLAGWPVTGNLTGTAVLLLTSPVWYLRTHGKARKLAPPSAERQARRVTAPLSIDESKGEGFAKLVLAICLLTGFAIAAYVIVNYEALPDRVPTFSNLLGLTDHLADKSIVAALFIPSLNLVSSSGFAMAGLLIARAKRSVRGGSGGRSVEAQDAFRVANAHIFSGTALFICLLLALLSLYVIRAGQSPNRFLNISIACAMGAMLLFMVASLIRIMKGLGQGGALLEEGSVEAPLTGGLADNAHWVWGIFYVDKDDPSLTVESRFGIGYTFNFGNRNALLLMGTYAVLSLGLTALVLTGTVS